MRKVAWLAAAESALREIYVFSATRWGPTQADKYLANIAAAGARIAKNPGIGRGRPDVPRDLRVYRAGRHLLVYRTTAEQIEVLTILHPAMDLKARVAEARAREQRRRG